MRTCIGLLTVLALALTVLFTVEGSQQKEVTIKGRVTCAKCELAKEKTCMTVVVEKKNGKDKDVVYYFDKAGHTAHHGPICTEGKEGTVTGTVEEAKDGKKTITVKAVTYPKK